MTDPHMKTLYNEDLGDFNDFRLFAYAVQTEVFKLPGISNQQWKIVDFLSKPKSRLQMLMAFRGLGKTNFVIIYAVWLLLINPNFKVFIISKSAKHAIKVTSAILDVINGMDICSHIKPLPNKDSSKTMFKVRGAAASKDNSVESGSVGGQLTGGRGDFIIVDDAETSENSNTPKARANLEHSLQEIFSLLKTEGEDYDPRIIVLGTPHTEQSIYYKYISNGGWDVKIIPARYPDPENITVYRGCLDDQIYREVMANHSLVGKPTDSRMNEKELSLKEGQLSLSAIKMQYQLDPSMSDSERYTLKCKDFIIFDSGDKEAPISFQHSRDAKNIAEHLVCEGMDDDKFYTPGHTASVYEEYTQRVMFVDPAGGLDETAYCVMYFLRGYIHLMHLDAVRGLDDDKLGKIVDTAKHYNVQRVICEKYGGGSFTKLLQSLMMKKHVCSVEDRPAPNNMHKEKKIVASLYPVLKKHRLVVSSTVIEEDLKVENIDNRFVYQLTRMTEERGCLKHDDRVDVVAQGVLYFAQDLGFSTETAEEDAKMDIFGEEIRAYWESLGMQMEMESRRELDGNPSLLVGHLDYTEVG